MDANSAMSFALKDREWSNGLILRVRASRKIFKASLSKLLIERRQEGRNLNLYGTNIHGLGVREKVL